MDENDGTASHGTPSIMLNSPRAIDGSPIVGKEVRAEKGKTLGTKDIGSFLSFVFIINQIYGPGVLAIPIVFQQCGWVPTTLAVFAFMIISCMASTLLSQAIATVPGNQEFDQRIEFATAVKDFYGRRWHYVFQIFLNITVQSYNIASIVVCAQSLDQAFMWAFGSTYAFQLYPSVTFTSFSDINVLYSSAVITISLGYALMCLLFLPQGFQNLNDNVKSVQLASFVFLAVLCVEFIIYFLYEGAHHRFYSVPAFGSNYTQLISVFIFSWAYVIFVPSWLNEKKPQVSVNRTIWSAGITSFIGYVCIGILCASVFEHIDLDNMLVKLSQSPTHAVTRVTAHLFSLGVIAPGIPVCSVTTRYNLYVGKICSKKKSYFWGVFAPWMVSFVFCQGEFFAQLLNWTSLIFNGIVNFVLPCVIYMTAMSRVQKNIMDEFQFIAGEQALEQADVSYAVPEALGMSVNENESDKNSLGVEENGYKPSSRTTKSDLSQSLLSEQEKQQAEEVEQLQLNTNGNDFHAPNFLSIPENENGAIDFSVDLAPHGAPLLFNTSDVRYHLPVFPWPLWARTNARRWTLILFAVVSTAIITQVIVDIYYLAALKQNLLSN